MRYAVIVTLQALYDAKEVTALKGSEFGTTRLTNEISTLRNSLGIDIITDRVNTTNNKWYGKYRLIRTDNNLTKVKHILAIYSNTNEDKDV